MSTIPISNLSLVSGSESGPEVNDVYEDIQKVLQVPFVPDLFESLANSPNVLAGTWEAHKRVYLGTTLPMSLKAMVLYSISAQRNCEYCATVHHVTCRTLGVDEQTLQVLVENLEGLTPVRVQTIIKFALECAADPQGLGEEDFQTLRSNGISDEEIMEIIGLAAWGVYLDVLADSIKVPVDEVFANALD